MMNKKLKERQETAASDPSYVFVPPSPPRRFEKWLEARVDAKGNFISEESKKVAETIVSITPNYNFFTYAYVEFIRQKII